MDPEHGHHEGAHQHGEIGELRGRVEAMETAHRAALDEHRAHVEARLDGFEAAQRESAAWREAEAAREAAAAAQAAALAAEAEADAAGDAVVDALADAVVDPVEEVEVEEPGSELEPPEVPAKPPAPKEKESRGMWDRYH